MKKRVSGVLLIMFSLLLSACVYRIPDNTQGSSNPALLESESTYQTIGFDDSACRPPSISDTVILGNVDIEVAPYIYRDFTVTIDGKTMTGLVLYSCTASVTNAVIPSEVNGLPVLAIGNDHGYVSVFAYPKALKTIVIPDTVCYIGGYTFLECVALTELTLPAGVKYIGWNAFQDCPGLRKLRVTRDMELSATALYGAIGLEELIIEEGFNAEPFIQPLSFNYCSRLKELYLPDSITCNVSFGGCSSLTDVNLSNNTLRIVTEAFRDTAITFLEVPEGCISLAYKAFVNTSIESIVLPSTLDNVEYHIFDGSPLKEVFFRGTEEQCLQELKDQVAEVGATLYYYSETEPTEEGNFWHYVDGKPVIW